MKLTKSEYEKIAKGWLLKAYQRWDRLNIRLKFFAQFAPLFEGMDVLEFGCNAGMYAWEVAHYAKSVIGVDPSDRYMDQAVVTEKAIHKFNPNVSFVKRRVKGWIRDQEKAIERGEAVATFNAMCASFAIYHLCDAEIRLIERYVLPKCELVIIQNRTKKRTNRKKNKLWREHNGYKFEKNKNMVAWLEKNGFECELHWGPDKKFCDAIGRRKDATGGDADGDTEVESEGAERQNSPKLGQGRPDQGSAQPVVDTAGRNGEDSPEGDDGSILSIQGGQGAEGVCPAPGVQGVQKESPDEGLEKPSADGGGGDNPESDKDSPRKTRPRRARKTTKRKGVGDKDGARPLS